LAAKRLKHKRLSAAGQTAFLRGDAARTLGIPSLPVGRAVGAAETLGRVFGLSGAVFQLVGCVKSIALEMAVPPRDGTEFWHPSRINPGR
jgi:hypothetical protein